ncbi:dihydroorotate dehydrogenase (quinone), mitochondrial [Aethina tumida]|uniref:dihydroorotate dehydrogenase (quinone), mitochondrial n=1 Tax=Aethina tumida TaxID=116153 RepID=UPI0021473654|nr:dihydroorotate dehydrogenase (quinone), mitochondrial [Aethina tumida]
MNSARKLRSMIILTASAYTTYAGISFYRNEDGFYKNVVMPAVHLLDPEKAHNLAIFCSKHRLLPKAVYKDPNSLKIELFNKTFKNPLGIAAGFDKNGEAVLGLRDIGFGFIEIGSVTPLPQPGNEKPRVFRLNEDKAVINRYGFNSDGHDVVYERIKEIKKMGFDGVLGVNLGKNKLSPDPINDYILGIKKFGPIADYLVINISSPNTPGLRNMQSKEIFQKLLCAAVSARNSLKEKPPLLIKLAPDLSFEERRNIAQVLMRPDCAVDGLIISNTTVERPDSLMNESSKEETGGLSGKPLKNMSTTMIAEMRELTQGKIPIIGVGGISTGLDAYEKIKAGASVVQIYTSMVYDGPPIVTKIKSELDDLLKQDGLKSIAEAVGRDAKF